MMAKPENARKMRKRPKNGRKRMKNARKSIVRKPAEKTPEVSGYLPALSLSLSLWKRSRGAADDADRPNQKKELKKFWAR